ncbi:MAG: hypothetical protein KGZ32_04405, partial [Dethiobacter sp.]|nr:hypothetical protein [Dethiobacter sp.]
GEREFSMHQRERDFQRIKGIWIFQCRGEAVPRPGFPNRSAIPTRAKYSLTPHGFKAVYQSTV